MYFSDHSISPHLFSSISMIPKHTHQSSRVCCLSGILTCKINHLCSLLELIPALDYPIALLFPHFGFCASPLSTPAHTRLAPVHHLAGQRDTQRDRCIFLFIGAHVRGAVLLWMPFVGVAEPRARVQVCESMQQVLVRVLLVLYVYLSPLLTPSPPRTPLSPTPSLNHSYPSLPLSSTFPLASSCCSFRFLFLSWSLAISCNSRLP